MFCVRAIKIKISEKWSTGLYSTARCCGHERVERQKGAVKRPANWREMITKLESMGPGCVLRWDRAMYLSFPFRKIHSDVQLLKLKTGTVKIHMTWRRRRWVNFMLDQYHILWPLHSTPLTRRGYNSEMLRMHLTDSESWVADGLVRIICYHFFLVLFKSYWQPSSMLVKLILDILIRNVVESGKSGSSASIN